MKTKIKMTLDVEVNIEMEREYYEIKASHLHLLTSNVVSRVLDVLRNHTTGITIKEAITSESLKSVIVDACSTESKMII